MPPYQTVVPLSSISSTWLPVTRGSGTATMDSQAPSASWLTGVGESLGWSAGLPSQPYRAKLSLAPVGVPAITRYWFVAFLRISRMPRLSRFHCRAEPKVAWVVPALVGLISAGRLVTGTTRAFVRVEVDSRGARKPRYTVVEDPAANSAPSMLNPSGLLAVAVAEAARPRALSLPLSQLIRSVRSPV